MPLSTISKSVSVGVSLNSKFTFIFTSLLLITGCWFSLQAESSLENLSLRLRYWTPFSQIKPIQILSQLPFKDRVEWHIDESHRYLGDRFVNSATWFDRYFNEDNKLSIPNESYVRLITGIKKTQGETLGPLFAFKARVHLPYFKKKFKLLIDSTSERLFEDQFAGSTTLGQQQQTDNNYSLSTALRWSLLKTINQHWVIDSGIKVRLPPKVYLKTEYQAKRKLSHNWTFNFNQKLFGIINDESGGTSTFELSHPLGPKRLFKVHQRFHLTDKTEELEATHGYQYYQQIDAKKGFSIGAYLYGHTEPEIEHTGWAISTQYKMNIFRPWVFFFVEPSISYPRDTHWKAQHSFSLGFESYFGNLRN